MHMLISRQAPRPARRSTSWLVAIVASAVLAGCSSPWQRASELEAKGDFAGAAQVALAQADEYAKENVIVSQDHELRSAIRLLSKGQMLDRATEVANRRVALWAPFQAGQMIRDTSTGALYDPLKDVAAAHVSLAEVCAARRDTECVARHGDIVMKLFSPRVVPTFAIADPYGQTVGKLAETFARVGLETQALRAAVLSLSTGHGLTSVYYFDAISRAKAAGNTRLEAELTRRQGILDSVPKSDPGVALLDAAGFRAEAAAFRDWATRLEKANAPTLAAMAHLEALECDKRANDQDTSDQNREAARQEQADSFKQIEDALRTVQRMKAN